MWRSWPGIAEVLSMSILALMWIQATFKASQQQKERATANLIDRAEAQGSKTGSTSSACGTARTQESVQHHGGLPKAVALVFMVLPYLDCTVPC